MIPNPRFSVTDSNSSLHLGSGDTESQAIVNASKSIETSHNPNPHKVMLHDCNIKGYSHRSVVIGIDGLISK
jgi:hypothetical protein